VPIRIDPNLRLYEHAVKRNLQPLIVGLARSLGVDAGARIAYLPTVRKVKNRAAVALVRKRWAGTTAEERKAQTDKMREARSAKAAARREAQSDDEALGSYGDGGGY